MKKLLIPLLLILSLQSFSQRLKIRFTSPSFQKGGWIIPTSTFIGASIFAVKAIQANSKTYTGYENHQPYTYKLTEKRNGYALYSAALLLATFTITISMQSDK